MAATVENVVERVKSFSSVVRGVKSGKPDGATTQLVQETIEILATYCDFEEVVPVCLKFLDEVLTAAPQTSTLIRLEGGAKIFPSIIRNFMGVDASILALCAKVMCKCASGSPAMQHHLVKEKGLPTLLLSCCSAHAGEPAVVGPLLEVLVALARYSKGATALSNANLVHACKELLVGLMGHWHAFGMVLKLIKSVMKHEGPCLAALKAGEVVRLLLGVARLVSRMPDQRKLLKRASRTLWVLSQRSLHPLPEMEPNWPAPTKDAAHLNVFAALDADLPRHMELFPEDYACAASQAVLAQQQCALGFKATIVRPVRSPSALPPSVASTSAADAPGVDPFHTYGGTLNADMMMHDLRRVVHPSTVINRLVYLNGPGGSRAAAAAAPQDGGSGGGGGGIGGGGGGADGGSGGSADASTSGSGQDFVLNKWRRL